MYVQFRKALDILPLNQHHFEDIGFRFTENALLTSPRQNPNPSPSPIQIKNGKRELAFGLSLKSHGPPLENCYLKLGKAWVWLGEGSQSVIQVVSVSMIFSNSSLNLCVICWSIKH